MECDFLMADMILPHSVEAEACVIGAILLDGSKAMHKVRDKLLPDDFYRSDYALIYKTMLEMENNDIPIDILTLTEKMIENKTLNKVGGPGAISYLGNQVPTSANVQYYVDIVYEKSTRRNLIKALNVMQKQAEDEMVPTNETIEKCVQQMISMSDNKKLTNTHGMVELAQDCINIIQARYENKGDNEHISTGLHDLDKIITGFYPGDLVIIAARPSMGKTAFAMQLVIEVALEEQKPVAVFSLEMTSLQLMERLVANLSEVDAQLLKTGQIDDEEDWRCILEANSILYDAAIQINDKPDMTIADIRAEARRIKAEKGLAVIIIDYLQLIKGQLDSRRSMENRQQEIAEISRSLKAMAKELNVPVIALSQLNRGVESRENKRPLMSDLRDSGAIEQDADIIMTLYRDEYYNPETPDINKTEIAVVKHRSGPVGIATVYFQKECGMFKSFTRH